MTLVLLVALALAPASAAVEEAPAADELMRRGRYAEATRAWTEMLATMPASDPRREDLENRKALYAVLADVPPPGVALAGEASVRLRHNALGSWNVPVDVGGRATEWIFDTGADLSTLAQSEADALGLKTRETAAYVRGSTGARNAMRLAVAPEIRVGSARLTSVVFLVLPDEALFVAPIRQQIHGILGVPVLSALGRMSVSADGELRIGAAPAASAGATIRFDGWSPIVEVAHGGHPLRLLAAS
jgi:predicted aspartyl protease